MTISTELRKAGPFTGNGVTTAFPFSFKVFAATDVTVTRADTLGAETKLVLNTDFTVALNADQDAAPGGTVTLAAPLSTGYRLVVSSAVPNLQPTDITNNGGFYPRVIEDALDRQVAQIQQIAEKVGRALKVAVTSPLGDQALPSPVAGMLIGWNESNDGLKNYAPIGGTLLGQQLAAANGSSLVGFQQAGAGAVVRTAQDKMREWVSPDDFGAVGDGVADDTAAVQAAFDSGAQTVNLLRKYKVTSTILCERSVSVVGGGKNTGLDASSGGTFTEAVLLLRGSITQIPDLSANVSEGAYELQFASAPPLSPHDVICIYNPTAGSWFSARPEYNAGEFLKVFSVSGTTVTVFGQSVTTGYGAGQVDVYKLNPLSVLARDFEIVAPPTGGIVSLKVTYGTDVRLDNINGYNSSYAGIAVNKCYNVRATGINAENASGPSGNNYGFVVSNCQNVSLQGHFYGTRHAVAIGGDSLTLNVTNRNVLVHDSVLENLRTAGVGAADLHGNVENVKYSNCIIRSGGMLAGRNIEYNGCTIFSDSRGNCIYGSECYGGSYSFVGCTFVSNIDPALTNLGAVSCHSGAEQVEPLTIAFKDCHLRARNWGAQSPFFRLSPSTTQKINTVIDGLSIVANAIFAVFQPRSTVVTMAADYYVVDNVVCDVAAAYLVAPHTSSESVQMRLMRQGGKVQVTTNGTGVAAAVTQPFRFQYPRIPSAIVTAQLEGSTVYRSNGFSPTPYVYSLAVSSIRPAIITPATGNNMATGDVYNLFWAVSIDEV